MYLEMMKRKNAISCTAPGKIPAKMWMYVSILKGFRAAEW